MTRAYPILCGVSGAFMILIGLGMFFAFLGSLAPGSVGVFPFPLGPQGYYFVAFTGSCLVAWGGCLIGAARGHGARVIGTATAVGLVLGAFYSMLVWFMGDFAWLGDLPRVEAAVLLLLALAFVWLRPPASAAEPL